MHEFEREDVTAILRGVLDMNVRLSAIARDVRAIREFLDEAMKKKDPQKKTPTAEEWLTMGDAERHERTQRLLAERIAYHERKLAEVRGARGGTAER